MEYFSDKVGSRERRWHLRMSGEKKNILIIFTDFNSTFCKASKKNKIGGTVLVIGGFRVQEASINVFRAKIAALGNLNRVIGGFFRICKLFHRSK